MNAATQPQSVFDAPAWLAAWSDHGGVVMLAGERLYVGRGPAVDRAAHQRLDSLREMLLHAPPAVVAGMLGYTPGPAEAIAAQAGATWKHYAAGDHKRTRSPKRPL